MGLVAGGGGGARALAASPTTSSSARGLHVFSPTYGWAPRQEASVVVDGKRSASTRGATAARLLSLPKDPGSPAPDRARRLHRLRPGRLRRGDVHAPHRRAGQRNRGRQPGGAGLRPRPGAAGALAGGPRLRRRRSSSSPSAWPTTSPTPFCRSPCTTAGRPSPGSASSAIACSSTTRACDPPPPGASCSGSATTPTCSTACWRPAPGPMHPSASTGASASTRRFATRSTPCASTSRSSAGWTPCAASVASPSSWPSSRPCTPGKRSRGSRRP